MTSLARCVVLAAALSVHLVAFAAPGLDPGRLNRFNVEIPTELRRPSGPGSLSLVTRALVTVAVPANFDPARVWPVMVVNATSDRPSQSSRALLGAYAETAMAEGWLLIAADPAEEVALAQDDVALRNLLDTIALAALNVHWPGAKNAPLAVAGFSGGSKYSGWIAASLASQGRSMIGIYLSGCNENTIADAARHFKVYNDRFREVPIFLQSGVLDVISTPVDHRRVRDDLEREGFKNVRIEYFAGPHTADASLLHVALNWFREFADHRTEGK